MARAEYRERLIRILEALTADPNESDDHLARALEEATLQFEAEAQTAKEAGLGEAFRRRRLEAKA